MRLGSLGPMELILIVTAIVLIFGASKLGDIGGALGKSIKEFKKQSRDENEIEAGTPVRVETERTVTTQEPVAVATVATERTVASSPPAVSEYRPPDAKTS